MKKDGKIPVSPLSQYRLSQQHCTHFGLQDPHTFCIFTLVKIEICVFEEMLPLPEASESLDDLGLFLQHEGLHWEGHQSSEVGDATWDEGVAGAEAGPDGQV